jgi:hypothetical protein
MLSAANHLCLFALAKPGWEESKQCNFDQFREVVYDHFILNNFTGSKKPASRCPSGIVS